MLLASSAEVLGRGAEAAGVADAMIEAGNSVGEGMGVPVAALGVAARRQ
jgi:hypothetical protein